jgi:hypothetical protein
MNVALFLDIDGVLCDREGRKGDFQPAAKKLFPKSSDLPLLKRKIVWASLLDKKAVDNLDDLIRRISEVAQVSIILSSAWREGLMLRELKEEVFKDWGFSRYLIARTPIMGVLGCPNRVMEIDRWLSEKGDFYGIQKFIILDDTPFSFPRGHFVRVDPDQLLSEKDVEQAWDKIQSQPLRVLPSQPIEASVPSNKETLLISQKSDQGPTI